MRLEQGLERLGLVPGDGLCRQLNAYLAGLSKWNRAFNLVSAKSERESVTRHVLDSLSVLASLEGERVLDVGTGAGLPGLVLAIAAPTKHFTLLDANVKKTRFCLQMAAQLGLGNVDVVHGRLDDFDAPQPFSTVVSRAYGPADDLLAGTRRLCQTDGRIICMKGARPSSELDALGPMRENARIVKLDVPGLDAERHLLVIELPRGASLTCGRETA